MSYKPNILISTTSPSSGTTSGSFKMMGLGLTITPNISGVAQIMVNSSISGSSTTGCQAKIMYGTGSTPTNGATETGTLIGQFCEITTFSASATQLPLTLNGIVSGLTIGTSYWFDTALLSLTSGNTVTINNITTSIIEI